MTAPIYPVESALAQAAAAGVEVDRLFRVLWPVWEAEVEVEVLRERPFGLIDRFLVRAMADGGFDTAGEIADFLGLSPELIDRAVRRLRRLGHLEPEDGGDPGRLGLTGLGRRALADGMRYEPARTHHVVLFDAMSGEPLPARYQAAAVVRLTSPARTVDGVVFHPLFAPAAPHAIAAALADRPDRVAIGLPVEGDDLEVVAVRRTLLPAYVVQTAGDDLLVYTAAAVAPDAILSPVAAALPSLRAAIASWAADRPEPAGPAGPLVPPAGRP